MCTYNLNFKKCLIPIKVLNYYLIIKYDIYSTGIKLKFSYLVKMFFCCIICISWFGVK